MVRAGQGGSVVSFLVIGAVLVLLLVGGLYYVRHNLAANGQVSDDVAQQDEGETNEPTESDDLPVIPGGEVTPSDDSDTEPQGDDSPQPDLVETPSTEEVDSQEGGVQPSSQLPETGSGSALVGGFALSVLAATSVAYFRSR